MNSLVKWTVAGSLACGMVGLGVSACADNETSIFIRQVLAPSEGDCTYKADPGQPALLVGTLDLAFRTEYWAGLLVGSQLVERGDPDMLRVESARFRAEGAEVRIETADGVQEAEFTTAVTGFADPAVGRSAGWGVVGAVLIDSLTGRSLAAKEFPAGVRSSKVLRRVVVVKVFGRTLGGQEVESGELRFPVELCYGCLISFPPGVDCASSEEGGDEGGVCLLGQDQAIDCRVCYAMMRSDLCV